MKAAAVCAQLEDVDADSPTRMAIHHCSNAMSQR
jgi:hypothetical protein